MPNFYNYTESGQVYSFDDVFVPVDAFRQGNLWAWGRNDQGQLGINDANNRCTPVTTTTGGANWKQVACAFRHSAAIKTDGTLWTWGKNDYGQLGVNAAGNKTTPVTTFAGGTNWKQVACNGYFTSAIKTDGTLWTWGDNTYGQLGNNTTISRTTPVTTFAGGTNWKQVACGSYFAAAIKTDGTLWTWGRNLYPTLGINNTTDKATPVTTFAGGTNWKQVSCGDNYTSAIKTDGTLWTWGLNNSGQMGDNTAVTKSTPVTTFAGGTNWKQVSCGLNTTLAIKTDGTLWVWGGNAGGQIGDNTTTFRVTPVTTFAGGANWKQVASSSFLFSAATKTDGTLWTWGTGGGFNYGNLGTNDINARSTPVTTFLGGTNWKQVAVGDNHTAATTYIDNYQ
jgi:alpha-tubulin suppressor-like RCC1 family protein